MNQHVRNFSAFTFVSFSVMMARTPTACAQVSVPLRQASCRIVAIAHDLTTTNYGFQMVEVSETNLPSAWSTSIVTRAVSPLGQSAVIASTTSAIRTETNECGTVLLSLFSSILGPTSSGMQAFGQGMAFSRVGFIITEPVQYRMVAQSEVQSMQVPGATNYVALLQYEGTNETVIPEAGQLYPDTNKVYVLQAMISGVLGGYGLQSAVCLLSTNLPGSA